MGLALLESAPEGCLHLEGEAGLVLGVVMLRGDAEFADLMMVGSWALGMALGALVQGRLFHHGPCILVNSVLELRCPT